MTTTTNEAAPPSNLNVVNIRATEEQFDEDSASEDEGYDSEEEDDDSEHEWSSVRMNLALF